MAEPRNRVQKFIGELKRRHVTQVAFAYCVIAFGGMQVVDTFFPALKLPDWTVTAAALLAVVGLPIAICLAWAFDITPAGVQAADPGASRGLGLPRMRRFGVAALVLGVMIVAGAFAIARVSTAGPQLNAIAVLPFQNMSGDPNNEYFSDGITDDVLTQLSKIDDLKVISRTSVMQYKQGTKPIGQIAAELKVGAILEGSVRRDGDRVRIVAQLIDASNDKHLWAESYDRDIRDIFVVQSEIAREIADALRTQLTPEKRAQLKRAAQQAADPLAYEEYLRGVQLAAANRHAESNVHLQRAIAIQPRYAPAHAALARNYYFMTFLGAESPNEMLPKVKESAQRALALDGELADAHATQALYLMHYEYDFPAAERAFQRALELAPANAQVRHDYAHFLVAVGRSAESAGESVRAAELDPNNSMLRACAGWHRFSDGHFQGAVAGARQALMMMPNAFWPEMILGWGYEQSGDLPAAIAELRKATVHSKQRPFAKAALAHALAVHGERPEAERLLGELTNPAAPAYVSPYDVAAVHAGLGNADQAFAWLNRAHGEHAAFLVFIGWDPRFAALRTDARYQDLLEQLKMPRGNS